MGSGIERDVERLMRGESAEPDFLNDTNWETYFINADYECCLGRISYLQKRISSLEQRVKLLNAQIALWGTKGLNRRY